MARADGRHDHLHAGLSNREVFTLTSFREPALSSASQAGLVNNLNDGLAWGLFPILFAAAGLSVGGSECWPRCTRQSGASVSWSPAHCRTVWVANG